MSRDSLRRLVRLNGDFVGTTDSQELTNKTLKAESNIIRSTTPALGNILKDNGTKYVPLTKGSAGLPLRVNDAATDVGYTALGVAGGGTGVATISSGSLLVGAGTSAITTKAAPSGAILGDSDVQNITGAKTWTDQTFKLRNPAGTFTGTVQNPALTANANLQLGQNSEAMYVVYVDANTGFYTAKNARLNDVISSTSTAETAIQAAITAAGAYGTIIIRDGTYTLSGAFTGFTFLYNQKLIMGRGCNIRVPNAYTGSVFKLIDTSTNSHVTFEGGLIDEVGTAAKDWTCFEFNSTTTTGLTGLMITACRIVNAGKGIALLTDTNGWVNAGVFSGIYFDLCEIAVEWAHTGTYTDGGSGANNNTFIGCTQQYTSGTTNGFKDVNGRRNQFINCYTADFSSTASTMNITINARYTIIEGGSVTFYNFRDASPTGSIILDGFNPNIQMPPSVKKQGRFFGGSQTATFDGIWTAMATSVGNAGSITRSSAGLRFQYATGNTINTLSGVRITAALLTERDLNPATYWKFQVNSTTNARYFIGFYAGTPATGADPLNAVAGVLLGYDSGVDGNWHIYQNDGTGASNSTTINNVAAINTSNSHTLGLKADNTNAKFQYSYDGGTWTDINTDIPAATTGLGWAWWAECLAASNSRQIDVFYAYTQQDG